MKNILPCNRLIIPTGTRDYPRTHMHPIAENAGCRIKFTKNKLLVFRSKKDFTQGHVFTSTYQEHLKYAKEYQQALNLLGTAKNKNPHRKK